LGRWKSPEILKGESSNDTEKSCGFTIGMMIYTILIKKKRICKKNEKQAIEKTPVGNSIF
jgi:hypothetical protein